MMSGGTMDINQYQNPVGGSMSLPQHTVNNLNGAFELRAVAVERTKKRLDKYRKNSESKEKTHDEYKNAQLARDIADTSKYLVKVTEQKQRKKTGRDKKDDKTGVGGLSKSESMSIMSKIRADIKSSQKHLTDKRPKESKKTERYPKQSSSINFDPSQISGAFPEQLPNIDPSNVQLNDLNPAELDEILNPSSRYEDQANLIKQEGSNSPHYTQLQPSQPSMTTPPLSSYPSTMQPTQNGYPNYQWPNYPMANQMAHPNQMQHRYPQATGYPQVSWGHNPQMMPSSSANYQYTPNEADFQYMGN